VKVITLRNIPPDVARLIERRSKRTGASLNKTVISLLEDALGVAHGAEPASHRDLDALAGVWSDRQADEFDEALAEQRRIDPEMWE
jgi:hypothetical protein